MNAFPMQAIEAYASAGSIFPGETISFHVRIEPPHFNFKINIYRKGRDEALVHSGSGMALAYDTPDNASEIGCGWPPAYPFVIPDNWSSGVYIARLTSVIEPSPPEVNILFVVKASAPGANTKILLQLTATTYEAYNNWGGKSLYVPDDQPAVKVSFNRPNSWAPFYTWELGFIAWLENNKFDVEYCTSIDLHASPEILNNYQLLLSVGHDEYWSWEMRDNVEAFVGNGGNVAFFSANVCWWQVRFEDNNRTMVCYKNAQADIDANPEIDPRRLTINWISPLIGRRENQMTGVSYENGAAWWKPDAGPRPAVGYSVQFSEHWVFDKTGLSDNDEFGAEKGIVGYETDAAIFVKDNNIPQVTGADETPLNFQVLATADLSNWAKGGHSGSNDNNTGKATLGVYRNKGVVFTAATTDWSSGLTGEWNAVQQITHNVITRLRSVSTLSPDIPNSGFEQWSGASSWIELGHANIATNAPASRAGRNLIFGYSKVTKGESKRESPERKTR